MNLITMLKDIDCIIFVIMALQQAVEAAQHDWIVHKFSDTSIPWNWRQLSQSPLITWKIVEANHDKQWCWYSMCSNPNMSIDYILANPELPWWNWAAISEHTNIVLDIIKANPNIPWNWILISQNPNITWDIVQANPELPWAFQTLCLNPNMTWDIIQVYILQKNVHYPLHDVKWNWYCFCMSGNVTDDNKKLHSNPVLPWDWHSLSYNDHITWDIVQSHLKKPWNWAALSKNKCVTWEIIQKYPRQPWNWQDISENPNITWDIVKANLNKRWNFYALTYHPNITWDIVQANPDYPWDKSFVRPYQEHLLTLPPQEVEKTILHIISVRRIQKAFKECYYNPSFQLCRRRLHREFENMKDDL